MKQYQFYHIAVAAQSPCQHVARGHRLREDSVAHQPPLHHPTSHHPLYTEQVGLERVPSSWTPVDSYEPDGPVRAKTSGQRNKVPLSIQVYPELGVVYCAVQLGDGGGGLVLRLVPGHCVQQSGMVDEQPHPRQ